MWVDFYEGIFSTRTNIFLSDNFQHILTCIKFTWWITNFMMIFLQLISTQLMQCLTDQQLNSCSASFIYKIINSFQLITNSHIYKIINSSRAINFYKIIMTINHTPHTFTSHLNYYNNILVGFYATTHLHL